MQKDVFAGCHSPVLWVLAAILIASFFVGSPAEQVLQTVFFLLLGGLCVWNYRQCGRVHCRITGYGFLGVGILALLNVSGVIAIADHVIWAVFFIVLVAGYGIEFAYKQKKGPCYVKQK